MTEVFFRATPWALPGAVAGGLLVSIFASRIAKKIHASPLVLWIYATSILGFASVTMTPAHGTGLWGGPQRVDLHISFPRPSDFATLNTDSLNVVLGLILGLSAVLLVSQTHRAWPLVVSACVVFLAEGFQWILPVLGRSAFLLDDVFRNLLGLVAGAVVGFLLLQLGSASQRTGGDPEAPEKELQR